MPIFVEAQGAQGAQGVPKAAYDRALHYQLQLPGTLRVSAFPKWRVLSASAQCF